MMPSCLHSSQVNLEVNCGSRSLIILVGSPKRTNTCLRYDAVVSSVEISSTHGINIDAFVQSWSVMVRIESYPWDLGNLVIKSRVIISNGIASGFGKMGCSMALIGQLLTLCR